MAAAEAEDGAAEDITVGGAAADGATVVGGAADGVIAGGAAGKRDITMAARRLSWSSRVNDCRTGGACERVILSTSAVRRRPLTASLPQAVLIMVLASTQGATSMEADLAKAKAEFRTYCSACHGTDGQGGGPAAKALKDRPSDLTKLSKRAGGSFPAELVFQKIEGLNMPAAHGTSDMPIWGEQFVEEELGDSVSLEDARTAAKTTLSRINSLVKYLEAIQR